MASTSMPSSPSALTICAVAAKSASDAAARPTGGCGPAGRRCSRWPPAARARRLMSNVTLLGRPRPRGCPAAACSGRPWRSGTAPPAGGRKTAGGRTRCLLGLFQADAAARLCRAVVPGKAQHPVDQPGAGRADALHLGKLLLTGFPARRRSCRTAGISAWAMGLVFLRGMAKTADIPAPRARPGFPAVALDAGLHAGAVVGMDGFDGLVCLGSGITHIPAMGPRGGAPAAAVVFWRCRKGRRRFLLVPLYTQTRILKREA